MPEEEKPIHPRKLEIVHAAVTCFLERGYHQTGVRDIARQAGISLGNLYNHFKGKEGVLAFVAEIEGEELSGFFEGLSDTSHPQVAMERFIEEYAAYVSRPENALLGVEILTEAIRNPTIAEVFGRNRNLLIDALVQCLCEGGKRGAFRQFADARAVAFTILDALEGNGLRSLSRKAPSEETIETIQKLLFQGLKA